MMKKLRDASKDSLYDSYLLAEIIKLRKLQRFIKDQEEDLIHLYQESFPKKCNVCDRVYPSREEYLSATSTSSFVNFPNGPQEKAKIGPVMEYRTCACNNTLVLLISCRRDQTLFGQRRRALFQRCVRKLVNKAKISRTEAVMITRSIFKQCIRDHSLFMEKKKAA